MRLGTRKGWKALIPRVLPDSPPPSMARDARNSGKPFSRGRLRAATARISGRWAALADVLKKTTKEAFGPVRTWQVVRELGFTSQKPQLRAKERDEKAIQDWKTRRLPGLKKMGSRTWVLARI